MATREDRIGLIEANEEERRDPRSAREQFRSHLVSGIQVTPEQMPGAPSRMDRLVGEFGRGMLDELTLGHGEGARDQALDPNQAPEGTPLLEQLRYIDETDVAVGLGRLVGALPGIMVTGGVANLGARFLAKRATQAGAPRAARFFSYLGRRAPDEAEQVMRRLSLQSAAANLYEGTAFSLSTAPFRRLEEGQSRARQIALETGVGAAADFLLGAAVPYARAPFRTLVQRLGQSDNSVDREVATELARRLAAGPQPMGPERQIPGAGQTGGGPTRTGGWPRGGVTREAGPVTTPEPRQLTEQAGRAPGRMRPDALGIDEPTFVAGREGTQQIIPRERRIPRRTEGAPEVTPAPEGSTVPAERVDRIGPEPLPRRIDEPRRAEALGEPEAPDATPTRRAGEPEEVPAEVLEDPTVQRAMELDPELGRDVSRLVNENRYDALTRSGSRRAFQEARPSLDADPGMEAVALDLNNFSVLNNQRGHDAGDEFLQRVAAAIRQVGREMGIAPRDFRTGGDEFVAYVPAGRGREFTQAVEARVGVEQVGDFPVGVTGNVGRTAQEADAGLEAAKRAATGGRQARPRGAERAERLEAPEQPTPGAQEAPAAREDLISADDMADLSRTGRQYADALVEAGNEREVFALAADISQLGNNDDKIILGELVQARLRALRSGKAEAPAARPAEQPAAPEPGPTAEQRIEAAETSPELVALRRELAEAGEDTPALHEAIDERLRELAARSPAETRSRTEAASELEAQAAAERARGGEAVELGEPVRGPTGSETQVIAGDGTRVPARYRVIEADELVTSHDPSSFQQNPRYPEGVQERNYHADQSAQERVAETAQDLDPDIVLDPTSSPTVGPPQVTRSGIALGGNQRGMGLKRAISEHPDRYAAYREALEARAEQFGVDPEQLRGMENPVLVREVQVEGAPTRDQLRQLGEAFNVDPQKARSTLAEAGTRAARLERSERALRHLEETIEADQTVRAYLRTARGQEFLERLIDDGVITRQEASRFRDPNTGLPTDEGFSLVEDMLQMAAIRDPDVVARAPKSALRKIEHATPAIIDANTVEGFPVSPALRGAMDLLAKARASNVKLRDLLSQRSMFDEDEAANPIAAAVANFIDQNGPRKVAQAFRRVAADAKEHVRGVGENLFGEPPRSFEESVYTHMGSGPGRGQSGPIRADRPGFLDVSAIISAGRAFLRRHFKIEGDLPPDVFRAKVEKDGWVSSQLQQMRFTLADLRKAVRQGYGARLSKLPEAELQRIDAALKGEVSIHSLPDEVAPVVLRMRNEIDALSQKLIEVGAVEGKMAATVTDNMGVYATRSYRKFDDPQWASKVPEEVRNKAKALIRSEYPAMPDNEVEGLLNHLLFTEDGPMALIRTGKLGQKDLTILRRRKDIPPEIRALWGEYRDPVINYARSVTKMAHLVGNHRFLTEAREMGLGRFFHENPVVQDGVSYHAQIAAEASDPMYPLSGLHTTEEILREFNEAMQGPQWGQLARMYFRANGVVKYAKTVGSVMTHIRNLISNGGFLTANGHIWRPEGAPGAFKGVMKGLGSRNKEEWRSYYRKLQELGVVDESARAGELQDAIRDASQRGFEDYTGNAVQRSIRRTLRGARDLYRAEDDLPKIWAFENEVRRYSKARGVPREQVEREAAEIVRNTFPTYSLVPRAIRNLRRFPLVGTFVSFPAEVFRVSVNTIGQASRELADPQLRGIGAARLVGILTAAAGVEALAVASRQMTGTTTEEEEDIRRFLPPWSKHSTLVHLGREPDGTARVVDLSYTDPYAYLRTPITAFLRGEDWEQKVAESVVEAAAPFLEEEIFAEKWLDISRNQRKDGGRIWNPEAPAEEKAEAILSHILDAVEPGTWSSAERVYKGVTGGSTLYSTAYDPKIEAMAMFTGFRVQRVQAHRSLSFRARDYQRRANDALGILRSAASGRDVDEPELRESYGQTERRRQRLFTEAHRDAQAAIRMGMTERQVRQVYESAGLSQDNARRLVRGEYRPYKPSSRFLEGTREAAEPYAEDPTALRRDFISRRRLIRGFSYEALRQQRQEEREGGE